MSNVEVWNRCALPFLFKKAEYLTSTFCGSLFDILRFILQLANAAPFRG